MAAADYWLCDICDRKTFYDAQLDYDTDATTHPRREDGRLLPRGAGDMAAICQECVKENIVVVMRRCDLVAPST